MSSFDDGIHNAIIESAEVQIDRGFIVTVWVNVNYGGSGQGFGGYVLGGVGNAACANHGKQPNLAADFLAGVMQAADVERLSSATGKAIRVKKVDGAIVAIGHIIRDDRWYEPKPRFDAWRKSAAAIGGEGRCASESK